MEESIKEIGLWANLMDLDFSRGQMDKNIKDSMLMGKKKAKEPLLGLMAKFIEGVGSKVNNMEKVKLFLTEHLQPENGNME
jgi:hypothetical protein